jgi:serine/threonine protein phosphatase PrpC
MFGVFDGHGGAEVAKFCQKYMATELQRLEEFGKGSVEDSLVKVFHRMVSYLSLCLIRRWTSAGLLDVSCLRSS